MPKPQQKQLAEVHEMLDRMVNKVKVNGTEDGHPVTGLENVLEYIVTNQKIHAANLKELNDIHQQEWARRDFRKSLTKLIATSPMLASCTPMLTWRMVGILILASISSYMGISHGWFMKFIEFIITKL